MFQKMHDKLGGHFPSSKAEFFKFLKISVPVIIAFLFFTLNNFVDNFQVTGIDGGVEALGIANTWTNLLFAGSLAIAYITISTFAQFYGAKLYKQSRDTLKFRLLMLLSFSSLFIILAQIFPRGFIELLGPGQRELIVVQGITYLRLVTIAWFLLIFTSIGSSVLQQVGMIKTQFFGSVFALATNVTFNVIFINVLNLGVAGAAGATILARVVAFTWYYSFLWRKHPELFFKFTRIFKIHHQVWEISKKRIFFSLVVFGTQLSIVTRYIFWNYGYQGGSVGSNPLYDLSAASVLGIVGALTNMILATINSIDATVSIFVAQELGRNNIKLAKANARALKGFNVVPSLFFSFIGIILILVLPHLHVFARGRVDAILSDTSLGSQAVREALAQGAQTELLFQIQMSLVPITVLSPIWIWFITSAKVMSSGRFNQKWSIIEFIINMFQLTWIIIVAIVLSRYLPFWAAYWVFFASDLVKIIPYETIFYRVNWATNLTSEEQEVGFSRARNLNFKLKLKRKFDKEEA